MVLYSDDHGETWHRGGHVPYHEDGYKRPIHTCEAQVSIVNRDDGQYIPDISKKLGVAKYQYFENDAR